MQYSNFIWRNGQPYSETFDDIYYSSTEKESISGESEFNHVFFKNNRLPERWSKNGDFIIAELGFGSGLNCLLTIREWLKHLAECGHDKCLHYIAIEKYPLSPGAIVELLSQYSELKEYCDELVENYPPAIEGVHGRFLFNNRVLIHYKFMDVFDALKDEHFDVNCWYLDGFSPAKNSAMWSDGLFEKIAQNSCDGSTCSTYTAAGFVKRNLQKNGFIVNKVPGFGKKREMLTAHFNTRKKLLSRYNDKPWYKQPVKHEVKVKQATIIGAGIAGLCMAHALVKRGWSVTIIDKHGDLAKETSANPAAIIYPRLSVNNDIDSEFYLSAYFYSLYILKSLQNKHEKKFWFDVGLLQLMNNKRAIEIFDKFQFNHDYVSPVDELTYGLVNTDSDMHEDKSIYIEYKAAGMVRPAALCEAIRNECGDRLNIIHAEIDSLKRVNQRWQCLSGTVLINAAETVVIANGIDVNKLGLPLFWPLEKVRGQVAVLNENSKSKNIKKAVNAEKYITPAIQNKHYLGATYSRASELHEADPDDDRELLNTVNRIYPDIFNVDDHCDSWVGFRSMAKDRCPVVGLLPDIKYFNVEYADICHGNNNKDYGFAHYLHGIYITAAHGSRGFTSSFLSAEIVAAQIAGEPVPVSKRVLDYISPSRFIVNDLKRR